MAEFHFLRPWWLALLPLGIWLIWRLLRGRADGTGWGTVVDPVLRSHVLVAPQMLRESRWPLLVALVTWVVALVAMAGPAWERLPVPAFRSDEALVVALDLSRSMDAADIEPSRLARAKLKLLSLLDRRQTGQTALLVFSTHAFTVTPLTTDTRTITSLVTAVSTDIMPSQGSSLRAALDKAGGLLRQTGLSQGDILLITDADASSADYERARDLRAQGFRISVLAVGTEQGAPIAEAGGGFLTDGNGRVVVPQLRPQALRELASAGGGRFAQLAPDERDLDALFPPRATFATAAELAQESEQQYEADVWRDRGLMVALGLLPLIALAFRRGWVCIWIAALLLPMPKADAFEWQDLWRRADQRGYEALQAAQAERAAEFFDDPQWRSAAQYRAGDFANSAASLDGIDSAQSHYNRGNALAKAGRLAPAIEAYDRALELAPDHEDAQYNRDLLEEFLRDNPEQQQSQEQGGGEQGDQQQASEDGSEGSGEQADGEQSEQDDGSEGQDQQASSGQSDGKGSQDQQADNQNDAEGDSETPEEQTAESSADDEGETGEDVAPGPQDVEQWASEQAAEQWLRRIPQDPGGLLRRKFQYQYQRLGVDQEGNSVWPGDATQPW